MLNDRFSAGQKESMKILYCNFGFQNSGPQGRKTSKLHPYKIRAVQKLGRKDPFLQAVSFCSQCV